MKIVHCWLFTFLLVVVSNSVAQPLNDEVRDETLNETLDHTFAPSTLNLSLSQNVLVDTLSENNFIQTADAGASNMMSNGMDVAASSMSADSPHYEDRMFTGNKVHQYLGIGSLAAALLAAVSPKEEGGPHEYFAKASAFLGGAAVASGFYLHSEDIEMNKGLSDPDNMHALLAGLGAVGLIAAAATGPDVPHATYGALGAISMAVGIRYTW